jgi:hypothetical protein
VTLQSGKAEEGPHLNNAVVHVYANLEHFGVAWSVYRGVIMSAATLGTASFRPLAYWPLGQLRKAATGDVLALTRFEKEIAIELVRREHYPEQVSRLHGLYAWEDEETAVRCERKWRQQHFSRENLIEIGFSYSRCSRVDTQWIDDFVLDDYAVGHPDETWIHEYWRGEPRNEQPHWELILEGRGLYWGTTLRMKALEKVREHEPHSLFFLEAGRLAVLMEEHEVNSIAPFVISAGHPDQFRVEFYLDHRLMQTAAFQTRLGQFIRQQPKEQVNWTALGRIDDEPLRVPDLRDQGFAFPASLLSARARAALATIVAPRNLTDWPEERA